MTRITNVGGISLALAVWILHDEYDYIDEENYISVTGLMKPLRQIILPQRIPPEKRVLDVQDFTASALGKAIHDSVEKAWLKDPESKLRKLGIPEAVISRVMVNPSPEAVLSNPDLIAIYLEQRAFRSFRGYTIGGKFDMVAEGIVQDNKSTSAFAWTGGNRDNDHRLQLSLYRWLDAGQKHRRITEDYGIINYVFTDWSKMMARNNPQYPQKRVEQKQLNLLSVEETERYVINKLALIDQYMNVPEDQIPHCTDEELWRSEPKYKYFSDPAKAAIPGSRSTKNFDSLSEANLHLSQMGKGTVLTVPGEVKRCGYCPAFEGCSQKDQYL